MSGTARRPLSGDRPVSRLDVFDRILGSLHEAMLDDARWPAAAGLIDEACGIRGNALVVGRGRSQSDGEIYLARFCYNGVRRPDRERWYFELYYPRDERVPRIAQAPDGLVMPIADGYTDEELKTSAAYNEALPRGGFQNGLNVRLDGPEGSSIVWVLADSTERGGWGHVQTKLVEHLVPHMRHFVRVRHVLAGAEALGASLLGLLENGRVGVIQLDRRGRVLAANAPAVDILRNGSGLNDRDGALYAFRAVDHDRLQELLRRALPEPGSGTRSGGSMTLPHPCGGTPLALHVSPVGDGQAEIGGRLVAVLVLVVDPAIRRRIDPAWVAETFGLKASEGRVTALLSEGRPVTEIARMTGLTAGYVRLLLKRVYKKLGISGQVALVSMVLSMEVLPWD